MEQNDAEVNQNLNVRSHNQEQQKSVTQLNSKISLSNFQMLQLTHNDQKFTDRIFQLNQKGINSIQSGAYEEAILYLGQAQKLLQYAASCGRALDRQIILKILNNQAVVYQKTWQLQKSISYIQAVIFNLKTFLNSKQTIDLVQELKQKNDLIQNSSFQHEQLLWFMQSQFDKIKSILSKKYQLSLFYLQFSTLNSQNQDHQIALANCHYALKSFQQQFQLSFIFLKIKKALNIDSQVQSMKLCQLITRIHEPKISDYYILINQVQQIHKIFDKKSHAPSSFNYILQKYSSLQKKQPKYKNFSLTSVMELHSKSFGQKILDQSKLVQPDFYIEDIQNTSILIQRILEYAVTYFTISVQIKQLNNQSFSVNNGKNQFTKIREEQQKIKIKQGQLFYIISLRISIQIVEELTQFSRYIFKHYFQVYSSQKIKASSQSMSKMDSLKQKYKKYLPNQDSKNLNDSQDFCDNTISQYSINIKLSKDKENKLQKLFKQNGKSTPQNNNPPPPRLNIDLSQIESLEYGGSKTFKQNNQISNNLEPQQIIQQQEYDSKQTKKLNCLNVKKIKTVPNLSDVSSNRQSQPDSREKSIISRRSRQQKQISKSKQKNLVKQNQSKKNLKPISTTSKHKLQIKKFVSPKNINRKSHQGNSNPVNETQGKKKTILTDKKIFSDRKILINTERQNQKSKKQKKLLVFKQKKKKKQDITPQPSHRNISQRQDTQKNQQKLQQTKKISRLRKVKSFEQVIHPYVDIKPAIFQSKDISDTYNILQKPKLKEKLKQISQSKKIKSSENLKFTVKNGKKQRKKSSKLQGFPQNLSQNVEARQLLQTKDSAIKKKKKSNVSIKEPQSNSLIGWQQNAVRMSSISNLMNSGNQKTNLKKLNSSKSLHESSNYASGYLLKGLNMNTSQRAKAGSIAMTMSIKKK